MKKLFTLIFLFFSAAIYAQPGSLDSAFGTNGKVISGFEGLQSIRAITLQKNGKIIAVGTGSVKYFPLLRFNKNGSIDKSFGDNGKVFSFQKKHPQFTGVALQSDGKIVAAGTANLGGFYNQAVIHRFTAAGVTDSSFGDNGFAYLNFSGRNVDSRTPAICIQQDDKIIIAGDVDDNHGNQQSFVARFTANGKRDTGFFNNGVHIVSLGNTSTFSSVTLQPDGKIVIAGSGSDDGSTIAIMRFKENGEVDENFGVQGKMLAPLNEYSEGADVKINPDGKIIVAGNVISNQDGFNMVLLRLKKDGTMDSSFGTNGLTLIKFEQSSYAWSLAVQADGKIVVTGGVDGDEFGFIQNFALARLNPNGKPDNSFGSKGRVITSFLPDNGSASAGALQADGKIVAAGGVSNENQAKLAMARYNGNKTAGLARQQNQTTQSIVKLYPNPVKNILIIENLPSSKTTLSIADREGNIIKTATTTNHNFYWNIRDLKAGEYFLAIQSEDIKMSKSFLKTE